MWTCTKCGEVHQDEFDACWKCNTARGEVASPPSNQPSKSVQTDKAGTTNPYAGVLMDRYDIAYRFAGSLAPLGRFVRGVAVVLGFLSVIGAIAVLAEANMPVAVAISALVMAAVSAFFVYIFGTGIVAGGQLLTALLDIAVNTSPFLEKEEKAEMLELEES